MKKPNLEYKEGLIEERRLSKLLRGVVGTDVTSRRIKEPILKKLVTLNKKLAGAREKALKAKEEWRKKKNRKSFLRRTAA